MSGVREAPDWRDKVRVIVREGVLHVHNDGYVMRLVCVDSTMCGDDGRCYKLRIQPTKPEEAR